MFPLSLPSPLVGVYPPSPHQLVHRIRAQGSVKRLSLREACSLDWNGNIAKVEGCGTGSVEKTEDIAVARRFKKRGRRWYRRRANPVLKLRFLKLDGEWGTYWHERYNEHAIYAA